MNVGSLDWPVWQRSTFLFKQHLLHQKEFLARPVELFLHFGLDSVVLLLVSCYTYLRTGIGSCRKLKVNLIMNKHNILKSKIIYSST
jgi:hypothetical protein